MQCLNHMRRLFFIITAFSALLLSCVKQPEPVVEPQPLPFSFDGNLLRIDSLMQHDADSALVLLLDKACLVPTGCDDLSDSANACVGATGCDDLSRSGKACLAAADVNDGYRSLLISEALYKTGNAQLNRFRCETFQETSLQEAVRCFDSLAAQYPGSDDIVVLSARAHYMNGVGFYENDSVVEACREYLKTLEIMENRFDEDELVGYKAKFMCLTYNRLAELFSIHCMMESAIYCGEQALKYCKIEPTSKNGIANIIYHLGKQYDKIGKTEEARNYYMLAMDKISDKNTIIYRDILSNKALLDYKQDFGVEESINDLKAISYLACNDMERLTRFLTIGYIYYNEHIFDSAIVYLNPVYEHANNTESQILAANYLLKIYDSNGDQSLSNKYSNFITKKQNTIGEDQFIVSTLSDLYRDYQYKKMKSDTTKKRKAIISIIIVTLSLILVIFVIFIYIVKYKADKKMRAERQIYLKNKASMSGRLKRSNKDIRLLKSQIKEQKRYDIHKYNVEIKTFAEEPICILIMDRVTKGQFKSHVDYKIYKEYALNMAHIKELRDAINRHYEQFTTNLSKQYPELNKNDIDYCCLFLLGLTEADIAALMQRSYNTVCYRSRKLKGIFGGKEPLFVVLPNLTNKLGSNTLT